MRSPGRFGNRRRSTFGPHSIGTQRLATVSSGTSFAQVAGAILGKQARMQNPDKDEVPGSRSCASLSAAYQAAVRYHGARFTLRLADGSTETLIGPFSSREDVVNQTFPELTVHHARITEDRYFYERAPGLLPTSAAITDRLAAEIA
jgi:hypothetical protein